MNPFSPAVGEEMERRIREDSAEDIAALFRKHGLVPCQGDIFPELSSTSNAQECCAAGAILVDIINSTHFADLTVALAYLDGSSGAATEAFVCGFDDDGWDDLSYQYMFDKGKRVWELATQKEQA